MTQAELLRHDEMGGRSLIDLTSRYSTSIAWVVAVAALAVSAFLAGVLR